ncbi:MAG TPA: RDD family protein [Frankiaceae bacterium]|nr:RDD family protein [Frankiaceae bacterium]
MTTTPPEPPGGGAPGYGTPSQPPGYGAQPPGYGGEPGYGGPPPPAYGGQGGGMPPVPGQWAGPPLASWGQRAQSFSIDYFGPAVLAAVVQNAISASLGTLLWLAALAWGIYNGYLQGQTGQSTGKKQAGIRLLREQDGQPIGGGAGVGRFFLHIVDGLPCYLGFLWPLWDAKKQTFADKIMKTVVVRG